MKTTEEIEAQILKRYKNTDSGVGVLTRSEKVLLHIAVDEHRTAVNHFEEMREALEQINHTLIAHNKVDANTPLHQRIESIIAKLQQ